MMRRWRRLPFVAPDGNRTSTEMRALKENGMSSMKQDGRRFHPKGRNAAGTLESGGKVIHVKFGDDGVAESALCSLSEGVTLCRQDGRFLLHGRNNFDSPLNDRCLTDGEWRLISEPEARLMIAIFGSGRTRVRRRIAELDRRDGVRR